MLTFIYLNKIRFALSLSLSLFPVYLEVRRIYDLVFLLKSDCGFVPLPFIQPQNTRELFIFILQYRYRYSRVPGTVKDYCSGAVYGTDISASVIGTYIDISFTEFDFRSTSFKNMMVNFFDISRY